MKGFWWKLPWLRGFSPMRRGAVEPLAATVAITALALSALDRLFPHPAHVCVTLTQLGGTFLVAFAVETSWGLQSSSKRGSDSEHWVGLMSGVGLCALLGIAIALILSDKPEPLAWPEMIGFAWALVSIGMLGFFIALQPFAIYEWAHSLNTEYPDE